MEYAIISKSKQKQEMNKPVTQRREGNIEEGRYEQKDVIEIRKIPNNCIRIFFKNGTSRKIDLNKFELQEKLTVSERNNLTNKKKVEK